MKAEDVAATLELALEASGCDQAHVLHKPRLLSDNGSSYIAGELADWLDDRKMAHVRGAPYHPQTQGKIEHWHQTLKNRILLENYYLPGDLEAQVETFVDHYNHDRYHESLDNLTPADVTSAGPPASLPNGLVSNDRLSSIDACSTASSPLNINLPDEVDPPLIYAANCLKSFHDGQSPARDRFRDRDRGSLRGLRGALRDGIERHGPPPPAFIAGDTPLFERIGRIAGRWNRAALYRSNALHCADIPADASFGADARTGRLTANIFAMARRRACEG